jgi:hypothetical protein
MCDGVEQQFCCRKPTPFMTRSASLARSCFCAEKLYIVRTGLHCVFMCDQISCVSVIGMCPCVLYRCCWGRARIGCMSWVTCSKCCGLDTDSLQNWWSGVGICWRTTWTKTRFCTVLHLDLQAFLYRIFAEDVKQLHLHSDHEIWFFWRCRNKVRHVLGKRGHLKNWHGFGYGERGKSLTDM